jgi:uncharacterized membrane protein YeaQ/YmgE (transglycosylase-associated protein family)
MPEFGVNLKMQYSMMIIPISFLNFNEFVYLRDEIRGHHEMLNHRMSWFAATQSLLYGAYASPIASSGNGWFSKWLIPIVGALLCSLMIPAIESALERIRELRMVLKKRMSASLKEIYPPNLDWVHGAALLYPRFTPWLFLFSWLCVLLWESSKCF